MRRSINRGMGIGVKLEKVAYCGDEVLESGHPPPSPEVSAIDRFWTILSFDAVAAATPNRKSLPK